MQLIGMKDPSKGPDHFPTGVAQQGGVVILHNLSPFDLKITFDNDNTRQTTLMAWQPREYDFCGRRTADIEYEYLYPGTGTSQSNPPSSIIIGEAYAPGAPVPKSNPNYDRLSNLGNQTLPSTSTQAIVNDGNPPNSLMIQSTPNDQGGSAIDITNDGSAAWSILSNNILANVLNIIRGGIATEAQIIIGEPSDPTMTVLHGQADQAATAGFALQADQAAAAQQFFVYDGSLSIQRLVQHYEGLIDPSTYLTPNEGDIWFEG